MLWKTKSICAAALLLANATPSLAIFGKRVFLGPKLDHVKRTDYPANVTDYYTITNPDGVTIRYKMPGKDGVCETTPGVNSYSGYIDLAPDQHMFFWFFESRRDPTNDDLTLWLNGGPGSDSLIGLFNELGPCRISSELKDHDNPYSWTNVSNMLFLSQPVGTGFSYKEIIPGTYNNYTGALENSTQAEPTGLYPTQDPTIGTTDLAAVATWHVLQAFLSGIDCLKNNKAKDPKNFNLWTESYGGHYGPAFFEYFSMQNDKIRNGTSKGYEMNFKSLGIINGIMSEKIQAEYYPEFAVNNTYGIKVYNDTVYNYARFANFMPGGCQDYIDTCIASAKEFNGGYIKGRITQAAISNPATAALCAEATNMCVDNVEGPYYNIGNRGVYDVRHPLADPTPPLSFYIDWLNQAHIQEAVGTSLNYTSGGNDIYFQFQSTGDLIYPNFLADLKDIVNSGVRVALIYGDADWICNWFGGQAVSLQLGYKHQKQFAAAGYTPFMHDGVEYGETREYGNFSFTRMYEAGHTVPFYQPLASLVLYDRVLSGVDVPLGKTVITANLTSGGSPSATHTEPFVPLPPTGIAALNSWSSSVIASYEALDTMAPTKPI